jgi:hypothetical protein
MRKVLLVAALLLGTIGGWNILTNHPSAASFPGGTPPPLCPPSGCNLPPLK